MTFIAYRRSDGQNAALNMNHVTSMRVAEVGAYFVVQVELDEVSRLNNFDLVVDLGCYSTDAIANWAMMQMLGAVSESNIVELPTEEEFDREVRSKERAKAMKTSLDDLDLSVQAYNALLRGGMHTAGDVCKCTKKQLLKIRNLGDKTFKEIVEKLAALDLTIKSEED